MQDPFTVTLLFAPSTWVRALGDLVEMPVTCLVSKTHGNAVAKMRVDLATLRRQLPAPLLRPERSRFRVALLAAVEDYLGCKVMPIPDDRIEWGDADGA